MSISEFITIFTENPEFLPALGAAFVGFFAALAKLIELITGITASQKDDVYASKFTKFVATIKGWADRFGLNPKQ